MTTQIKKRLEQLKILKQSVVLTGSEHVDKESYLQMIDMNIEALSDITNLVDYVNAGDSEKVSERFQRFREV